MVRIVSINNQQIRVASEDKALLGMSSSLDGCIFGYIRRFMSCSKDFYINLGNYRIYQVDSIDTVGDMFYRARKFIDWYNQEKPDLYSFCFHTKDTFAIQLYR